MYTFNKLIVEPKIPENLEKLREISVDFWWTYNPEYVEILRLIDEKKYLEYKNPIEFLRKVSQESLDLASENTKVLDLYKSVCEKYKKDLESFKSASKAFDSKVVVFADEYGFSDSMPIYKSMVGIKVADYLKQLKRKKLSFVAIGLMYKEGMYIQKIDKFGNQINEYIKFEKENLPIEELTDEDTKEVVLSVKLADFEVYFKVWKVKLLTDYIYLLDTDIDKNSLKLREITKRINENRENYKMLQKILLGIGGAKLIDFLNIDSSIYHLFTPAGAFCILEEIKKLMYNEKISFEIAKEIVRSKMILSFENSSQINDFKHFDKSENLNNRFKMNEVVSILNNYILDLGIDKQKFVNLATTNKDKYKLYFYLDIFAIKNTVSRLSADTDYNEYLKQKYTNLWSNYTYKESPIYNLDKHIDIQSWSSFRYAKILEKLKLIPEAEVSEINNNDNINNTDAKLAFGISNEEILVEKLKCKTDLIKEIVKNLDNRKSRNHQKYHVCKKESLEDPGFKYVGTDILIHINEFWAEKEYFELIFNDLEKLAQILGNEKRKAKLILTAKILPNELQKQEILKKVIEISEKAEFKNKIIILENVGIDLYKKIIAGIDISVVKKGANIYNSSTYQKTILNFVYNIKANENIYLSLEKYIKQYYNAEMYGYSQIWIDLIKKTLAEKIAGFKKLDISKYINIYKEIFEKNRLYFKDITKVIEYRKFKKRAFLTFDEIRISPICQIEFGDLKTETILAKDVKKLEVLVSSYDIAFDNLSVEIYLVKLNENGKFEFVERIPMQRVSTKGNEAKYIKEITMKKAGEFAYTFRIIPTHEMMRDKEDMNLIKWYNKEEE